MGHDHSELDRVVSMSTWWLPIALLVATTIAQIAHGIFGGRLKRLETAVDAINKRRSGEENKLQAWYGDVDVRLARIEERITTAIDSTNRRLEAGYKRASDQETKMQNADARLARLEERVIIASERGDK